MFGDREERGICDFHKIRDARPSTFGAAREYRAKPRSIPIQRSCLGRIAVVASRHLAGWCMKADRRGRGKRSVGGCSDAPYSQPFLTRDCASLRPGRIGLRMSPEAWEPPSRRALGERSDRFYSSVAEGSTVSGSLAPLASSFFLRRRALFSSAFRFFSISRCTLRNVFRSFAMDSFSGSSWWGQRRKPWPRSRGGNVPRTPTGQPFDAPGKPLSGKLRRG